MTSVITAFSVLAVYLHEATWLDARVIKLAVILPATDAEGARQSAQRFSKRCPG